MLVKRRAGCHRWAASSLHATKLLIPFDNFRHWQAIESASAVKIAHLQSQSTCLKTGSSPTPTCPQYEQVYVPNLIISERESESAGDTIEIGDVEFGVPCGGCNPQCLEEFAESGGDGFAGLCIELSDCLKKSWWGMDCSIGIDLRRLNMFCLRYLKSFVQASLKTE